MDNAIKQVHPSLRALADTYEKLPEELRFLNEMLFQGQNLIKQVGGDVSSATDSYQQMEAEAGMLGNELKLLFNEGLVPVAAGIANVLREARGTRELRRAGQDIIEFANDLAVAEKTLHGIQLVPRFEPGDVEAIKRLLVIEATEIQFARTGVYVQNAQTMERSNRQLALAIEISKARIDLLPPALAEAAIAMDTANMRSARMNELAAHFPAISRRYVTAMGGSTAAVEKLAVAYTTQNKRAEAANAYWRAFPGALDEATWSMGNMTLNLDTILEGHEAITREMSVQEKIELYEILRVGSAAWYENQKRNNDELEDSVVLMKAFSMSVGDLVGTDGELTFLNETIGQLGPQMITWGGRTADQNRLLDEMTGEVGKLNQKIGDAQAVPELFGGLEDAEKIIGDASDRIGELGPAIDRLNDIQGSSAFVIKEATVNQEALNEAFFNSLDVTYDNRDAIQDLALSMGGLNEQQAAAIIKQWELEAGLKAVRDAFMADQISAGQAREAVLRLGSDGYDAMLPWLETSISINETVGKLPEMTWKADAAMKDLSKSSIGAHQDMSGLADMEQVLDPALIKARNLNEELDSIPGYYEAQVRVNMEFGEMPWWVARVLTDPTAFDVRPGGPPGTGGGGGNEDNISSSPSIPVGGQHGLHDFRVPPGFPNDSFPVWVSSGETVNVDPHGRGQAAGINIENVTVVIPPSITNPKAQVDFFLGQLGESSVPRG
jgi:hypothetical protein